LPIELIKKLSKVYFKWPKILKNSNVFTMKPGVME